MDDHRDFSDKPRVGGALPATARPGPTAGRPSRPLPRLRTALGDAFKRREAQPCRLAIDALSDDVTRLTPGGLYVVYAMPRTPGCDALIWESARRAGTRRVTIVLSRTRAETAARMRELGFIAGALARGWPRNLNVLAMPAPSAHADEPSGATSEAPDAGGTLPAGAPAFARLIGALRALKRFGFHAGALYFVEGAQRWFSWTDPSVLAREGRLLADWCAARRITLVLLVHPTPATPFDDGDAIAREDRFDDEASHSGRSEFHGACAGVARMRRTHGELLWHADFWRSGRALVTGEVHALRFTERGHLTVAPESASGTQTGVLLARDEERVVATRRVVANETWVPGDWELVDDAQAAVVACRGAVAATVLLDYTDSVGLEPLCAAVHKLRRQGGRALKIVVVERGQALRHQYELLLLSLGANLLLGRDLPFSRLQSLLRSLHGQVHTRPIASDYRASLAAALTDAVRGYLPVDGFCTRVQAVLERGAPLRLPHVMAKLVLLPDVAHVDVLKRCVPRRSGDVFTADAAHVYVFLFACRLPDADVALKRVFDAPVERWSDNVVFLAGDSIGQEAAALAAANRRAPMADYRDLFPDSATVDPRAGDGPAMPDEAPDEALKNAQDKDKTHDEAREAVTEAAAPLQVVERMLAKAGSEAGVDADEGEARRHAPLRRFAQPCPMPLRATEEK